jgi:hypothetical protein
VRVCRGAVVASVAAHFADLDHGCGSAVSIRGWRVNRCRNVEGCEGGEVPLRKQRG